MWVSGIWQKKVLVIVSAATIQRLTCILLDILQENGGETHFKYRVKDKPNGLVQPLSISSHALS